MAAPKISKVPGQQRGIRKKIHAGAYVHDEAFDENAHDLGPWVETPKSSRLSAFRYDYLNNALQVTWRNGGPAYIYLEVPYEGYRSMARAASKGKHIPNLEDNSLGYRQMRPEEESAPSNSERRSSVFPSQMIVVRGVPVYWGIETEPQDRSFLTRATLHEVLPPFRQSIHAFRIRVSNRHWLHLGTFAYDRELRRWRVDITTAEISTWGRRNGEAEEDEATPERVEAGSTESG